jgi:hypothetical protein
MQLMTRRRPVPKFKNPLLNSPKLFRYCEYEKCKKPFSARHGRQRFCSEECQLRNYQESDKYRSKKQNAMRNWRKSVREMDDKRKTHAPRG